MLGFGGETLQVTKPPFPVCVNPDW